MKPRRKLVLNLLRESSEDTRRAYLGDSSSQEMAETVLVDALSGARAELAQVLAARYLDAPALEEVG